MYIFKDNNKDIRNEHIYSSDKSRVFCCRDIHRKYWLSSVNEIDNWILHAMERYEIIFVETFIPSSDFFFFFFGRKSCTVFYI